jgi:hypothetical protein
LKARSVAGFVRGRGLLRHRRGPEGAARLAASTSLDDALADLADGPYGRDIRPGMELGAAQHAVQSALLWHLRILAGWESPIRSGPVRVLAAGFEINNVVTHLAGLASQGTSPFAPPPYFTLGSFSTVWPAVRREVSPEAVRRVLAHSAWGDPESVEPARVLLGMRLGWARRVAIEVPQANSWARQAASVLWSHLAAVGLEAGLGSTARRDLERVLGARAYAGGPPATLPRPWAAEAGWWIEVERESRSMAAAGDAGTGCTVGVVGLLAADAWRTGAALGLAGSPHADPELEALISAEA